MIPIVEPAPSAEAIMPLFHLNLREGAAFFPDEEGAVFDGFEHAFVEAFESGRELWHHFISQRRDPRRCAFEITDAAGAVLAVLPFVEILESGRRRADPIPVARSFIDAMAGTCRNKVLSDQVTAQIRLTREGLVRTAELLQQSARVVQRFKALSGETR
jgi:hypothetical protein